jgi:nitrogenase molybdenum-iron protein NifN
MDIASSNFSEHATVFGGGANLIAGLENVVRQYQPDFIGISTSCLAETIGEDISLFLHQYREKHKGEKLPYIIPVSTPSYNGTHMNGFHRAVAGVIRAAAFQGEFQDQVNILPGFLSTADLRTIRKVFDDFGIQAVMLPDYSETLDAPVWEEYKKIPEGGTPIRAIRSMGSSKGTIQFGLTLSSEESGADWLEKECRVPSFKLPVPVGVEATDRWFAVMEKLSGHKTPEHYRKERGRLIDSYIDGHKYVFEKKAVVYGEEDLVISLAGFLLEIGVIPVLCGSGGESGKMEKLIHEFRPDLADRIRVVQGIDFAEMEEMIASSKPDFLIGSSKGYPIARRLQVPLVRVSFPVHDRFGGQRIQIAGYAGTQMLFDRIVNAMIEVKQEASPVGYSYI